MLNAKMNINLLFLIVYFVGIFTAQYNAAIGLMFVIIALVLSSRIFSIIIVISVILFDPYLPLIFGFTTSTIIAVIFVVTNIKLFRFSLDSVMLLYLSIIILTIIGLILSVNTVSNIYISDVIWSITLIFRVILGYLIYSMIRHQILLQELLSEFSKYSSFILIFVFIYFIQYSFVNNETVEYQRYFVNYVSPGVYSAMLSWFTVFAANNFFNSKNIFMKIASIVSIVLIFICIAMMASKSGMISYVLAIILSMYFLNKETKRKVLYSCILIGIGYIALILIGGVQYFETILYRFGMENTESINDYSYQRYLTAVNMHNMLMHNGVMSFFVGNGAIRQVELLTVYYYTGYYTIAHNIYVSMAIQIGVLGLLAFVMLIVVGLKGVFMGQKQEAIFKVCLIVLLISGMFTPLQNTGFLWMAIGLSLIRCNECKQ